VAGALLSSLLMPPLVVVFLPLAWARARRCRYRLEQHRVVRSEGLLYRTTSSVLYSRIDSIRQDQGALGKMFGNGQVTILTAGSSRPDLVLDALPGHRDAYRLLQERYRDAERARSTVNPALP